MIRPPLGPTALMCAGAGALGACGNAPDDHRARPGRPPRTGETLIQGNVVTLPFVGTLSWHCQPSREPRRFTTSLVLPRPGATVVASLWADGHRVWKRRRIDPLPDPSVTLVSNSPPAAHRQTWRLRYHHEPATFTAVVRLRFHAEDARCLISPVRTVTHRE